MADKGKGQGRLDEEEEVKVIRLECVQRMLSSWRIYSLKRYLRRRI
jgi:hypothetical protein